MSQTTKKYYKNQWQRFMLNIKIMAKDENGKTILESMKKLLMLQQFKVVLVLISKLLVLIVLPKHIIFSTLLKSGALIATNSNC